MKAPLLIVTVCALAVGGAPSDRAVKKELDRLQGVWRVERVKVNGMTMPRKAFLKVTVTFNDAEMIFKDGAKIYDKIKFTPDPTKKPRAVDLQHTSGLQKGVRENAIYELAGDQLKLCIAPAKKDRPAEFASVEGSGQQLFILKRAPSAGK